MHTAQTQIHGIRFDDEIKSSLSIVISSFAWKINSKPQFIKIEASEFHDKLSLDLRKVHVAHEK